jgi:hypothetical protein
MRAACRVAGPDRSRRRTPGLGDVRTAQYDWFGSVSLIPVATALAGPAESAFGRPAALWGCAGLVVLVTALVLLVPDVRTLTRRTQRVAGCPAGSADAERPVGGLG